MEFLVSHVDPIFGYYSGSGLVEYIFHKFVYDCVGKYNMFLLLILISNVKCRQIFPLPGVVKKTVQNAKSRELVILYVLSSAFYWNLKNTINNINWYICSTP